MTIRDGLGPFELNEPIGQGGMGIVFRASHQRTGMSAAIKVIRGAGGEDEVDHFHREVEAHAGLVHPGIVTLFEYGRVDEATAEVSGGNIAAGSPFVAMEFSERGTVGDHMPLGSWNEVRSILQQVLDGLAFAHARGVIHRDLKPDNFLVFEPDASDAAGASSLGPGRVKLADFGIAHAFSRERMQDTGDLRAVSGTPYYMPPEQLRGEWRRYGPWTDMYALGCIAWQLVSGEPPFEAGSAMALGLKHESEDRPPLDPLFPVPDGVEEWIHRAMAVDPRDRFQRASDALSALPDEETARPAPSTPEQPEDASSGAAGDRTVRQVDAGSPTDGTAPTVQLSNTLEGKGPPETSNPEEASGTETATPGRARPVLPATWETDGHHQVSAPMVDTGLGLFGLREIPFVDRQHERDALWDGLHDVLEANQLRVTVLTGDVGSGKSRLAEWMVRRAHEVGATENFRARHAPDGNGAGDGLAGMVARKFHTWNLDREGVKRHLQEALPTHPESSLRDSDVRALTELLRPSGTDNSPGETSYRFSNHQQRYQLLVRLLERFSDQRAPAVWIDDLQWSADTVGWLDFVLRSPEASPAWIVATVRDDVLADRPAMASKINSLVDEHAACDRLHIESLTSEEHRQLVQRLLPLAPNVVDLVARRTEGNPLFAVQLVEDWVERGRLVVGDEGFEIDEPDTVELPAGIHDLWMQRLNRAVGAFDRDEAIWRAMEIAATMGRELDAREWQMIADQTGIAGLALVPQLVDRALGRRTADGWAWTHGMLVSSLRQRAAERGRLASHHRLCAKLLGRLERPAAQTAARRASHWIEAGELEEALGPLLEEASRLGEESAVAQARPVLERRRQVLDTLGKPPADPTWLEQWVEEAEIEYAAGDFEAVQTAIENVRTHASTDDGAVQVAEAERLAGHCAVMTSDLEGGRRHYQRALDLLDEIETHEASETIGRVYAGYAALELDAGELKRADQYARHAIQAANSANQPYDRLAARRIQAWAAVDAGDAEQGHQLFKEIHEEAQSRGFRDLQADCVNGLGGLASRSGDLQQAREWYERYARMGRELARDSHVVIAHLNIAETFVTDGDFESARRSVDQAEHLIERGASIQRDDFIQCLRLACAAGEGQVAAFESLWARYADGWPEDARCHSGHAAALEQAGIQAADHLEAEHSRAALELSRQLWRRLGHDQRVESVTHRLEARTT
jgi:serine/threonine protein kinase/tetratricopeptide (TPR) repeat protein